MFQSMFIALVLTRRLITAGDGSGNGRRAGKKSGDCEQVQQASRRFRPYPPVDTHRNKRRFRPYAPNQYTFQVGDQVQMKTYTNKKLWKGRVLKQGYTESGLPNYDVYLQCPREDGPGGFWEITESNVPQTELMPTSVGYGVGTGAVMDAMQALAMSSCAPGIDDDDDEMQP